MGKAARAIIIRDGQLLAMHRNKEGSQYYTLVGGRVNDDESAEKALKREVKEETGLDVTSARLVFTENHPEPYNSQFVYLCEVAVDGLMELGINSEEAMLNRYGFNIHTPVWLDVNALKNLPFRTPNLLHALIDGLKNGFPSTPREL